MQKPKNQNKSSALLDVFNDVLLFWLLLWKLMEELQVQPTCNNGFILHAACQFSLPPY